MGQSFQDRWWYGQRSKVSPGKKAQGGQRENVNVKGAPKGAKQEQRSKKTKIGTHEERKTEKPG